METTQPFFFAVIRKELKKWVFQLLESITISTQTYTLSV